MVSSVDAAVAVAAALAFSATNIDVFCILLVYYARASPAEGAPTSFRHVALGQLLGFTVVCAVSMLGIVLGLFLPSGYVRLLGLVPVGMGVSQLVALLRRRRRARQGVATAAAAAAATATPAALEVDSATAASTDACDAAAARASEAAAAGAAVPVPATIAPPTAPLVAPAGGAAAAAAAGNVASDVAGGPAAEVESISCDAREILVAGVAAAAPCVVVPRARAPDGALGGPLPRMPAGETGCPLTEAPPVADAATALTDVVVVLDDAAVVGASRDASASASPGPPAPRGLVAALVRCTARALRRFVGPVTLEVALVTIASGSDNVGAYLPLFAAASGAGLATTLAVFYGMLAAWIAAAYAAVRFPPVAGFVSAHGVRLLPILLITVGVYVLWGSLLFAPHA